MNVNLERAQRLELNRIVRAKCDEWDKKHEDEIDALILWELRTQLGFGKTRLKRFYKNFSRAYEELRKRYECEDEDAIWVCQQKLREIGVDIRKWRKEIENG